MLSPKSDSLQTRVSLLDRVKNLDDARSWEEFFRTYERLVRGLARQRGLRDHEAEDVAQEVFKRVAQTIHQFERVPRPGAFRKWLFRLTRWRADDKRRERGREGITAMPQTSENGSAIDPLDHIAAPPDPQLAFEAETRHHMLETLFKQVEKSVPPKQLQIFQLLVVEGVPVARVAELFNMSAAAVYVVKHRVTAKLREEVQRLPVSWD